MFKIRIEGPELPAYRRLLEALTKAHLLQARATWKEEEDDERGDRWITLTVEADPSLAEHFRKLGFTVLKGASL